MKMLKLLISKNGCSLAVKFSLAPSKTNKLTKNNHDILK